MKTKLVIFTVSLVMVILVSAGMSYGHVHVAEFAPTIKHFDSDENLTQGVYAPILMYHHIAAKRPQQPYFVSPQTLDAQFSWLKQNGYHVIPYDQFYEGLQNHARLPDKPVVITFDDGDDDQFTNALPILKKYNYTATFYIITGKVGSKSYMTWDQLSQLVKAGMDIEAHTVDHPNLARQTEAKQFWELSQSKQDLQSKLNITVNFLAYPGGAFDKRTIAQTQKAGYLSAATTIHSVYHIIKKPTDFYRITRIHIDDELPMFIKLVQGQPESLIDK